MFDLSGFLWVPRALISTVIVSQHRLLSTDRCHGLSDLSSLLVVDELGDSDHISHDNFQVIWHAETISAYQHRKADMWMM